MIACFKIKFHKFHNVIMVEEVIRLTRVCHKLKISGKMSVFGCVFDSHGEPVTCEPNCPLQNVGASGKFPPVCEMCRSHAESLVAHEE